MTPSLDIFPSDWICSWVSSLVQEEVRSSTQVRSNEVNKVFRLGFDRESLFLKIGPDLQREHAKLQWLEGRLPCPRPVGFTTYDATEALLMSTVEGEDLARLSASLPPQIIITRLAAALKDLHVTRVTDWPFGRNEVGETLVHGDACLPNFLYRGDHLSGYIDVGGLTVGEPEIDLAAAVWSLQYNLGAGHGLAFLYEYGLKNADEERVETLRLKYESS